MTDPPPDLIHPCYLPFTREQLRPHFTGDADANIDVLQDSARRHREFLSDLEERAGVPLSTSRRPRQIEKDERFWTAASLKCLFDRTDRVEVLSTLLRRAYGERPPVEGLSSWRECLEGDLHLWFEAQLPSPVAYTRWLREHVGSRHFIPYVLEAADRESRRTLEGPTHVDALLLNTTNGFSLMVEAKVLSDISVSVSFDPFRNQLVRNVDVMLEDHDLGGAIGARRPDRSLLALLTPRVFRDHPSSRLYGFLLRQYRAEPDALERDLPHRDRTEWGSVAARLGWLCFEDIEEVAPGACGWMG